MPVKSRRKPWPRCYWIICYYPPPDWRKPTKFFQVDPAKLSSEVIKTIEQAIGKMSTIGAIKRAPRIR